MIQSTAVFTGAAIATVHPFGKFSCRRICRPTMIAAATTTIATIAPTRRETDHPRKRIVFDPRRARPRLLHAYVTRSSTIARITIPRPPARASPTFKLWSAVYTWSPSPGYPTVAAITMMPSAIMIVWFTPNMIVGFAIGSCTLRNTCQVVDPKALPTSTDVSGTFRMPRLVSRIAGGRAKITVAIIAAVVPMLNSRTNGTR